MLTRKLQDLAQGIQVTDTPNLSGGVTQITCTNTKTIKNCINPVDAGDPVTLIYLTSEVLVRLPDEWIIRTPASTPFSIFPLLPTAWFMDMVIETSGLISATITSGPNNNLNWTLNANISGIKKDISLNNQAWNPTSTLYFTENGSNSTAQFAVANDGDEIDIRATTTVNPLVFHFNLARRNGTFIIDAYYREGA